MSNSFESYKHKMAKELLHGWLSEGFTPDDTWHESFPSIASESEKDKIYSIQHRSDFIQMEVPLIRHGSGLLDEFYCNGCKDFRDPWAKYSLCNDCDKRPYKKIKAIADIAIEHKGNIIYVFEIEHKNGLSEQKIEFYKSDHIFTVFVISADHILGQIQKPKILYAKEIIDNGHYYKSNFW